MQIKDLFERSIHRGINGVIKAEQRDEANVWQELDEYVLTRELDGHLRTFFDTYLAALDNPADASGNVGVWVSGFFGSGKSHFIKILSYLLANRQVTQTGETRRALDFFEEKISDTMFAGDIARAVSSDVDVLLFNIDSKADSTADRDSILQVFLKVFNEQCGYNSIYPHIAHLERALDGEGRLGAFKDAYKAATNTDWDENFRTAASKARQIADAYTAATGQPIDDSDAWLDRLERDFATWLTVENFAHMIREYLDQRGNGHRLVFLVDEIGQFIGGNTQLMLSLQTITENLGTSCDGRAWVIVTSQEDIDAVVGQLRSGSPHDFSKIQGRFRTRLSLSSANVDEVIQKRLLKKTQGAADHLKELYRDQADILKNQLSFSDTGRTFKTYDDADEFAAVYPFAPYQFSLVQSIFESVRKAGATGLHLARGERSLLDAFQSAAKAIGENEMGVLVPLHRFYPSIESFLEGVVKSTIENARTNPSLQDFDVPVLQTLFLIRYVDEIPGNVDNLITLFLDEIDADRRTLRDQIEASLQRLEGQTLVSRNGDNFFFLTNEERDISREIKAIELTAAEETKTLGQFLFDNVLGGLRKFRFTDNGNDFPLNLACDMHPHGSRAEGGLALLVVTPLIDDRAEWTDARAILRSGENDGQVILRLPDDRQLATELRQYIQTDKFLLRRDDNSLSDSAKRIVSDRGDENRQRAERLRITLDRLLTEATPFVGGYQPQLNAGSADALVEAALHDLVRNTFGKLSYIEYPTPDPQAEIESLLDDPSTLSLDLGSKDAINARALKEVRQFVELASAQHRQIVLHDLATIQFARRPYGWPEWETVHLIIRLVKAGELSLRAHNTPLPINKVWEHLNPPSRWRSLEVQRRKAVGSSELQQVRNLARDIFGALPPEDEDRLYAELRNQLIAWRQEFREWRGLSASAGYPGKAMADEGEDLCDTLLAAPDSYTAIEQFRQHKAKLEDSSENHRELKHFFNSQQPVWDKLVSALRNFEPNRPELEKDDGARQALQRLAEIQQAPSPFGLLHEVEALVSTVDLVNSAAIDKTREHVLGFIEKQIVRVTVDLDAAQADADTRNRCLIHLQNIKKTAEEQSSLAHLHQLSSRALDA
ncbi:BREX system P-loop protein BrxC, partial [Spectribacter hydrogenoxidans]